MRKKRIKNGFTLVELLAVIVIMGILMMVAIPSITRAIENSRKDTFIDIAKSYANAVKTLWVADGLSCEGVLSSAVDDGDYYVLINTHNNAKEQLPILLDQGGKSSWGNRDVNGYVRVRVATITENGIQRRTSSFYVALSDGTHALLDDNSLTSDELKRGNVNMTLTNTDKKKVELTLNENGNLNCNKIAAGIYMCTNVTPPTTISGVCIDETSSVGTIGSTITDVSTFQELKNALENGQSPKLLNDIEIEGKINIAETVILTGNNKKLQYTNAYRGNLFNIESSGSLYITDLTIDGANSWTLRPTDGTDSTTWYTKYIEANGIELTDYIIRNKGNLTLYNTSIKNSVFNSGSTNYNNDLGIIYSTAGKINIDTSNLTNNVGLALNTSNTTVDLKNATSISNNFGTGNKGGIIITGNKTITMGNGVQLNNNQTIVRSGVVIGLINKATLIMNGGSIDYNVARTYGSNTSGSMIGIESGSGMIMNGGSISNNVGVLAGAISSRWNSGTHGTSDGIFLNNGTITGNTTKRTNWNNAAVFLRSAGTIGNDMIINGNVDTNSDGVLINNGTINGDLFLSSANAEVTNNKTVNGNVKTTASGAIFTNNGTVTGTIS